MKKSDKIIALESNDDYIHITTGGSQLRVYLVDDDTIRFRCTFDEKFAPEHSYALVKTAWPDELDELFAAERTRVTPIVPNVEETDDYYVTHTAKLEIRLTKDPFGIEIYDTDGNLLYKDLKERTFMEDSHGRRYHYSVINAGDHFYGFGEKTGKLNKRLQYLRMHNTDTCGHDAELSDPLYKHIPFYVRFNDHTRKAIGVFYNNPFDSAFDLGREWSGYWDKYSFYCTDGGDVDMFFINGPTIPEVVERYTDLTGKTALPPLGNTGYTHTTMFYTELEKDVDQAILEFVDRCKANDIPFDMFGMASGYTCMPNGKRYQFHWNSAKFPDPAAFMAEMKKRGVAVTPNVKPGILTTHPDYDEFAEAGAFIKDETGEKPENERYWGGFAAFPDFTSKAGREVWERHMTEALLNNGIEGIWDDNCEFDIQNADAMVDGDGRPVTVEGMKPVLGNMMAYTSNHALTQARPNTRPFIISRAGFAGIQRYAQTWAGDNYTCWKTLKYNIPTILNMGLSGAANHGCDIGGWFGPAPEPELLVRWFQEGVFMPRFMTNSSNTDNSVTEPFMYPNYTPYISRAVKLRYALAPTMYSLLREASVKGSPVMRPLVYEFPDDPNCWDESFEFMFGPNILVANVTDPGVTEKSVYLPAGTDWYDFRTKRRYEGGQTINVPVDLDTIPMFLRAGSIVPMTDGVTNLHTQTIDHVTLLVEPSVAGSFTMYEDDGETNEYKNGRYLATTFSITPGAAANLYSTDGESNAGTFPASDESHEVTVIRATCEGTYDSRVERVEMDVFTHNVQPFTVSMADQSGERLIEKFFDPVKWEAADEGWLYDMESRTTRVKYANPSGDYEIRVSYAINDLVKM
ncbi:TIM-barrel domain-containing protein [Bifidobacterium tissieri]|uniref:DUF4968 domain-containing protein n=1 Tax=Bifidobacterium tissieri TaxID=1630162 RepID=A0A5M9ZUM3_9BIFI|nr:TIM-barrel domain-containing protein [Bifidobacterium tissieri]KAA8831159.1 DUF4968 domain-containing protein [Bifidobacterium tissieri]KAA8833185.1 DUF4968 domain-containing protein [Bifidobacterium tissieri]